LGRWRWMSTMVEVPVHVYEVGEARRVRVVGRRWLSGGWGWRAECVCACSWCRR